MEGAGEPSRDETKYHAPHCALHSQFVSEVSSDGQFALLGSWDLKIGTTTRQSVGHTKDALSMASPSENQQFVSGS